MRTGCAWESQQPGRAGFFAPAVEEFSQTGLRRRPSTTAGKWTRQLRHIERVLTGGNGRRIAGRRRLEGAEADRRGPCRGPGLARASGAAAFPADAEIAPARRRPPALLTGTIALLGAAAFGVGIGLLAWSYALGRPELAPLGAPVALGGQIILLVGLILQMNRNAAAKLDKVEGQLRELKTTTTLLGTTHSPSAAAFYAHLASGASPQILLTDLKSQLDILAVKLDREE